MFAMADWKQGGWTGSVNRWANREVRQHLSSNPIARLNRDPIWYRSLRLFFSIGTFRSFIISYIIIAILCIIADFLLYPKLLTQFPFVTVYPEQIPRIDPLIFEVSSYLGAVQVGLLAIISLPLALVTLIAQGEHSTIDVRIYYHQSFAFELVASCIALLAALSVQIVWPIQTLLEENFVSLGPQQSKIWLSGIHLAWLLMNLVGFAHFVAITFGFVQQSTRERLRKQYTANVVLPQEIAERLRQHLYGLGSQEAVDPGSDDENQPGATFGFDFGPPYVVEGQAIFSKPVQLHDVHMIWVQWVVRRWAARCLANASKSAHPSAPAFGYEAPRLWFTPRMDHPIQPGAVGWCRRRGGVPLTRVERFVLRRSFRFRAAVNDS